MTTPRDTPLTRFLATQTAQQLREMRSEFRAEIDGMRRRLDELEDDLGVVEEAIASKSGKTGKPRAARQTVKRPPEQRGPGLRQAVLEFVGERPNGWTKQEIMVELERRGAAPGGANPDNTLITRLREMVQRNELEKFGDLYRIGAPNGQRMLEVAAPG